MRDAGGEVADGLGRACTELLFGTGLLGRDVAQVDDGFAGVGDGLDFKRAGVGIGDGDFASGGFAERQPEVGKDIRRLRAEQCLCRGIGLQDLAVRGETDDAVFQDLYEFFGACKFIGDELVLLSQLFGVQPTDVLAHAFKEILHLPTTINQLPTISDCQSRA